MSCRCNVQCYGRGDVHEKMVKKLDISQCEERKIPCVLFVYKVSRETEDLRNALDWVTEKQGVRREDICAVVLLEKSLDEESKPVDDAHLGLSNEKTVVVRILWKLRKNKAGKIRKGPIGNRQAMDKVKQSIRRLNMQCYGRGDVHEKMVKKLNIKQYEGPRIPCVLFVYKVSRETEDLRNALDWVTEKQGVRREDICAVVLLVKSLDKESKPVDDAHLGLSNEKTVVVRILWKLKKNKAGKIREGPIGNRQAMDKVKQSILSWNKTSF